MSKLWWITDMTVFSLASHIWTHKAVSTNETLPTCGAVRIPFASPSRDFEQVNPVHLPTSSPGPMHLLGLPGGGCGALSAPALGGGAHQ